MKVAVVGGGVVGLCSALDLARHGADVLLLERDECGSGASSGNCGWVTPALSSPLAEPGAAAHALLGMTKRGSPFAWQPRPDPAFLSWCWRFWRSSSEARWRRGAAQLLALNARTFQLFDELRDQGASFEMHGTGLVFASSTHRGLSTFRALFQAVTELGYPGTIDEWGPAEARQNEAALGDAVVGAFFAREERHVRPESLVEGLLHAVKAAGVEVLEQSRTAADDACAWSMVFADADVDACQRRPSRRCGCFVSGTPTTTRDPVAPRVGEGLQHHCDRPRHDPAARALPR